MFAVALLSLAAALVPPDAPQVPRPREKDGNKLVQVLLLADRDGVRAGDAFQLGVALEIRRGWHVYWENPGDAGDATRVELAGPPGFEIGRVRFPCPERHEEDGGIVSYVHEGSVLLVADVRAPEDLQPGATLEFRVDCDWLVCTDYCLPGSGRSRLALPALAATAEPKPANEARFAAGRALLPGEWKEALGALEPAFEAGADGRSRVVLEVPGALELEFFPDESRATKLVKRTCTRTERGARLELELEQINAARDVDYRGVLRIRDARGTRSVRQDRWRPADR